MRRGALCPLQRTGHNYKRHWQLPSAYPLARAAAVAPRGFMPHRGGGGAAAAGDIRNVPGSGLQKRVQQTVCNKRTRGGSKRSTIGHLQSLPVVILDLSTQTILQPTYGLFRLRWSRVSAWTGRRWSHMKTCMCWSPPALRVARDRISSPRSRYSARASSLCYTTVQQKKATRRRQATIVHVHHTTRYSSHRKSYPERKECTPARNP